MWRRFQQWNKLNRNVGNYILDESSRTSDDCQVSRGLVSLLELLNFSAHIFIDVTNMLREMETLAAIMEGSDASVGSADTERARSLCRYFAQLCNKHGWLQTARKAQRIVELTDQGKLQTQTLLAPQLRELRERLEDESQEEYFLHFEARDIGLYRFPEKGWVETVARFGEVRQNVIECSKCFALEAVNAFMS